MPIVARPGQPELYYALDDYTDPWKNAPYLILQHGLGRSGRFWYHWVPYLARWYKVVRPDIRGLGQSTAGFDPDQGFSVEQLVGDLLAVIDHLGATNVHHCGESLGGILGMALAAAHPQRVRTLTLVASPLSIGADLQQQYAMGYASQKEAQDKLGMRAWIAATNHLRFPPGADAGMMSWYEEEISKNNPAVQQAMGRMMKGVDAEPYLARIAAPVLGLYPTDGPIVTPEQ